MPKHTCRWAILLIYIYIYIYIYILYVCRCVHKCVDMYMCTNMIVSCMSICVYIEFVCRPTL